MPDDQQESESPLLDMARGAYKGVNDLINKIPTPGYKPQQSDHDKAVQDMNKKATDQGVQDANKSFIHDTQTPAQKKSPPARTSAKVVVKVAQRKR
jgi:hypothetical protein